ncbi:trypsin-like peptidase domain-containing protein [Pseudotenacibaculum sp. MALMAid0570]|uniref:trypsin-like peptidase domain-containing protein n=1 Tax=Pseudotenacibaculum sp. MALMAid0570 TaxID=3143938 RepID=UPI0032DF2051
MKKFFSFLSIAILGGVIALGGYKAFLEKPVVIERTNEQPIQTFQTNFQPAFETTNASYAPTNFTEAAEKTVNAVVHVKNTAEKSGITSWSDLFNGPRKYEQVGTGSGVIISSDGYIVTNNHVIANATDLEITLNNRKKYKAELVGTDTENDIALLKIDADEKLPYIPFSNSDNVKIGEWVLAVGNPYNLTSTVTAGIVSAKGRDLEGNGGITDSFIQTDAAVNPGNSGGALVNTRGELVGINTAITSRTGSYIGYSFAVPSNITKKIIDDILEYGKVQEAVIGFIPEIKEDLEGVIIKEISEDSDAKKSGLKEGDVIVKINDVKISKFSELSGQLKAKRPGEYVNVTVDRSGEILTRKVKLSKKIKRFISNAFQLEFKDLSKKETKKYGLSGGAKIIREARNDNGNDSLVGFIVTSINGQRINTADEASKLLDNLARSRYRIKVEMINTEGEVERYVFR